MRLDGTDDPWEAWFAWRSVRVWGIRGPVLSTEWTWMRWVERRLRPDGPPPLDWPLMQYRLPQS